MEKNTKSDLSLFERVERMHPYKMILFLSMLGSSLIFLFLLFSFFMSLQNAAAKAVAVPPIFIISTVLIVASSVFINPIHKLFKAGVHKALITSMRYTFLLGVGFAFCQLLGYRQLSESGVLFNSGVTASFLYVLTGLHAIHFIAAHTYLGVLIFQTRNITQDPIKFLIAETNPYWHLKYELLTKVWHFLGILWMILIISFWVFL